MEQKVLVGLIKEYCIPCSQISKFSSYGMKSVFEGLTGCYITDAEMREAMVLVGYKPDRLNRYKVRFANAPEIPTAFLNPRERIRRAKYGRI